MKEADIIKFIQIFNIANKNDIPDIPEGLLYSLGAYVTPIGGYCTKYINKTGANSIKGMGVCISSTVDNAVELMVKDVPDVIGVFLEDGIPDGSEAWIVVKGKAECLFFNTPTRKHLARGSIGTETNYAPGKFYSEPFPSAPFATDKHFYECGHVTESKAGPGLAIVELHQN